MSTILEVMQGRLGVTEIRGKQHSRNVLDYFVAAGHPEITTDEEAWCSVCVCSAAKEADFPFPPVNINMMARSWLTWGVAVDPADVQPGDIAVWPRGNPKGPFGHVNVVEEVVHYNRSVTCIGGNQETGKGADAVTRAKPRKKSEALGFRRGVPATVKGLRDAGSTTIKANDNLEKFGILAAFFTPIVKGFEAIFGNIDIPQFASLVDGLTWWGTLLAAANGVLDYALRHPFLAATLIAGMGAWALSRRNKAARVAEHAAGRPLSVEVAKLGAA